MAVANEDVQASHWEHAARPPAVPILRRALRRFAEDRGMDPLARDALDLALCEVVAHGVWAGADAPVDDRIVVDAAADREWMTVWVTCGSPRLDDAALPLATLAAEHVETAALRTGQRTRVTLEFPLVPDGLCVAPNTPAAAG